MPRTAIDYSKTIIYKIQHEENEELVYVGHTTDFTKRKCTHKSACNNEKDKKFNFKLYTMIRENGGWNCFKMVMIEEYPCANLLEACKREDECMRELKATMNGRGAVFSKEKQLEQKKQYREANQERIKQYREANKEKMKQYYEANRDEILRKQRERRLAEKTI